MIKLENLNRQHETISAEVNFIEAEAKKGSSSINVAETSLHISRLAGLLKMHLMEEDKFLYPDLFKCADKEIQTMANLYSNEMGDLTNKYTEYKNNYNVGSKITAKMDTFAIDTKITMEALKRRMEKEDNELYHLIKERKL